MILLISCFKEYLWCHIKLVTLGEIRFFISIKNKTRNVYRYYNEIKEVYAYEK